MTAEPMKQPAFTGDEPGTTTGTTRAGAEGVTLAAYAAAKRLPEELLHELGLRDDTWYGKPAVAVPYHDQDGTEVTTRYRVTLNGKRPMRSAKGARTKGLVYGLERRKRAVAAGYALVLEGESDVQTAALHGVPAFGIPGATMYDDERAGPCFDGIGTLYVAREPGKAGEEFVRAFAGSRHAERARVLELGEHKDVSALHLAVGGDHKAFMAALEETLARALPLERQAGAPAAREPVPTPTLTLAELLGELATYLRRYVVLSLPQANAVALWIVHTHALEAAEVTPYLSISSAEKRSGKTRLLEVLALLVRSPLPSANISDAALFRAIEERSPTLLMDEIDAVFGQKARDREDLRGLLNAGYRRGVPALRMGGPRMNELQQFATFCPKALAGIGRLPDTIADRAIPVRLKRRHSGERVERFRHRDARAKAEPLREEAAALAAAHAEELATAQPELPDSLGDRAMDSWEPLLAIAELAGEEWRKRAQEAAAALSGEAAAADDSITVRLLGDVRAAFAANGDRLATGELLDALKADEEAPWADWGHGAGLTARRLADLLRPHGITSRSVRLPDGRTPKGYHLKQFEDAFARYLPPVDEAPKRHNATTRTDTGVAPDPQTPHGAGVADPERAGNPHGDSVVADVADKGAENEQPERLAAENGDIPW